LPQELDLSTFGHRLGDIVLGVNFVSAIDEAEGAIPGEDLVGALHLLNIDARQGEPWEMLSEHRERAPHLGLALESRWYSEDGGEREFKHTINSEQIDRSLDRHLKVFQALEKLGEQIAAGRHRSCRRAYCSPGSHSGL
jgi:hypothetical protein